MRHKNRHKIEKYFYMSYPVAVEKKRSQGLKNLVRVAKF